MQKDYTIPIDDLDVTLKIDDSVKITTQAYDDGELYLIRAVERDRRVISYVLLEAHYLT